jgi:monothiol glutaredoxin
MAFKSFLSFLLLAAWTTTHHAFTSHSIAVNLHQAAVVGRYPPSSNPTTALFMSDEYQVPEGTKERIQKLVDDNPVLLFMKGSKLFPQCGFSNTAVQILNSFGIPFETVDVLSDESIRQGVKEFSQWPTIPQLYVAGVCFP